VARTDVVVTRAVGASVPGADPVDRLGDAHPGSVVVARSDEALPGGVPAGCLLVLLGDDEPVVPCFLHLSAASPASAVARAVAAARAALEAERERAVEVERQRELLEIGAALSAERDVRRLLERILTAARELVAADAGSLYLVEGGEGDRRLRFVLAHNDSVEVPWQESLLPVDQSSLAGVVAVTGQPLVIDDAYALPKDGPHHFNPAFDHASGYRTRSLLVVPMTTRAGELVGVLQLINRKRDASARLMDPRTVEREVVGFTMSDLELVRALASQAAVVLESSRLADEVRALFDSFVRASITAIEQRDPPTSGHSFRVAAYTVALARAAQHRPPPAWPELSFSSDRLQQLRYAALLHDIGKLGVREAVLTKRRRLYPDQERLVRERFEHARRALEVELLERALRDLVRRGAPPMTADLARVARARARLGDELGWWLAQVVTAADAGAEQVEPELLEDVATRRFPGIDGSDRHLLEEDELHLLQVGRGTLDEAERREIEAHVVHSARFLMTLPWPRHLRRVPEIAARHHEKLHGHGYPEQLTAEEIPVEVRMLTISDIYDALTSGDRPYRTAYDPVTALAVLEDEVREGAVDPDLVRVFIEAEVWKAAEEPGHEG
jgi:HD-GYP domain-containing protein (c-di-GMP phosphodiesterase class II)